MQLLLLQHIPRYKLDIPFLVTLTPEYKVSSAAVAPIAPNQVVIPPKYAARQRLVPALPKRGVLSDLDYREHANSPLATQIKQYVQDALYCSYVDRYNNELERVKDPVTAKLTPKQKKQKQKTLDKNELHFEVRRFYQNLHKLQLELHQQHRVAVSLFSLMRNGLINLLMLSGICRAFFLGDSAVPLLEHSQANDWLTPLGTHPFPVSPT